MDPELADEILVSREWAPDAPRLNGQGAGVLWAGLFILSCLFVPSRSTCAEEPDSLQVFGSWRWILSAGGLLGFRSEPISCGCERILTLKPEGDYAYVEEDSVHEYLLSQGAFTVHRANDPSMAIHRAWRPDFWVSLDHGLDDFERDLLVRFNGRDTLVAYPGGPNHGVDDALTHTFARDRVSGKRDSSGVRKLRLPLRDRPPRPSGDQFPGEGEFVYYEEPPVPVTQSSPPYPEFAREAQIQGTVILHVLVGKDGLVKKWKVIRSVKGLDEAAVEAIKMWVFKPALSNNKPVAVWVEIPLHFPPR